MARVIDAPEHEARLSDLLRSFRAMLARRWKTLALVSLVTFGLALALISTMPARYEAVSRVRIDPSRSPRAQGGQDQQALGSEAIETEVTVLSSPELAREVIRRLNLDNDPEYTKGLTTGEGAPLDPTTRLNRVTDQVLRRLSVGREKLTYIIAVKFNAGDPIKAATVANAFASTYIETRVDARIGTAARQSGFYREQLAQAGRELNAAQQRVAQYRASQGIVTNPAGGTVTDQQIAPLSTQLATAEAQAAEARSNLAVARRQIGGGNLDAVSAVRGSAVIGDLRRQRAEVERARGEIQARYGPLHPESIKVRDQAAALDQQIRAEANRVVGSLEAEASAADAQVASLRATLRSLRGQQANDTRASATAAGLDQDVANKKEAYDRLAQAAQESSQTERNSIAQAEIVDRARVPTAPAAPRKATLAALALVVSLAAGLAVAILQELLSPGMRSVAEVEDRFGLPVLASLPRVKGKGSPAEGLLSNATSMYAESLRNLRSSVLGVLPDAAPRTVAITSAVPEEGKSTAALSLARVSALSGSRTLLVECDVRRARLRQVVGAEPAFGLVETLRGERRADEGIMPDSVPGLDLLLTAKPFFSPEDLFGSGRLSSLLAPLRDRYALIVLDLPPLLGLADARAIALQADSVLLAVRWGSTPGPAVGSALSALRNDGAPVEGILFTMVDPKSEAIGGMYYSGKYSAYYAQPA